MEPPSDGPIHSNAHGAAWAHALSETQRILPWTSSPPCQRSPSPVSTSFYRYDELTRLLQDYARARPDLVGLRSIGKSHEGREIWLVTLTNQATGDDTDKPAFWVDGNIHAGELTASTACLYWLHQLVVGHGHDVKVTQLLDTRVVYLCPRLNPDGAELALADRPRHIRSSTRPYPWDEEPVEGLTVEDIDGDGRVLHMRIPDPHGPWKCHPDDPRLMTPREPGEFGGHYLPRDARRYADTFRWPADQRESEQGRPGPEPQLPLAMAAGARAGGRRPLPPPASPR